MNFEHVSVMLMPTVDMLDVREGGVYVDGTLGGGGIKPDAQEVERNPRARSAMLRGCEKLETQG